MKTFRYLLFVLCALPLSTGYAKYEEAPLLASHDLVPAGDSFTAWMYNVGNFVVSWQGSDVSDARLVVSMATDSLAPKWQSLAGTSFVMAAAATVDAAPRTGYSHLIEQVDTLCSGHSVENGVMVSGALAITGTLQCAGLGDVGYTLTLFEMSSGQLQFDLAIENEAIGRSGLLFASSSEERIFGFGEQFSAFDFKGKRIPIMVDEQGLSRGAQPLTDWFDERSISAAGEWYSTYAPIPHFITTDMRSLMLENSEFSAIDLRSNDQIAMEVYSNHLVARLIVGETPLDLVERFTSYSGRMRALPEWATKGLILGIQGGTDSVLGAVAALQGENAVLSAMWMQDWQGQRRVAQGERLWWNWELDQVRYPRWGDMVGALRSDDIRVMGYINPYVHELDQAGKDYYQRNLFEEAREQDFLIRKTDGTLATTGGANFLAYVVDVTNPEAREWYKDIIKTEMIGAGLSGWMADFGEALPLDTVLHSAESPTAAHNRYPEHWATLNREAIIEAGMADEALFFMRAAYTRSPGASTLFWAGDQTSNWDNYDGIKTSVTALLTSGLSGFAFNHSDVGGWLSIDAADMGSPVSVRRSKELMLRWIELGAFQSIFRTHEGLKPNWAHQFDTDQETLEHIARFSNVYNAWHDYRRVLVDEAAEKGWPLVRHPFLHYPEEQSFWPLSYQQYMIGSELWFAPVLDQGVNEVAIRLPEGTWVHAFTGQEYISSGADQALTIPAPIGTPAVLYREGSTVGEQFRRQMIDNGLVEPLTE
jgi:alpha-glucosidase